MTCTENPLPDCLTHLVLGEQGRVECWDPRVRNRVGLLDCALSSVTEGTEYVPQLGDCDCAEWKTACKSSLVMQHWRNNSLYYPLKQYCLPPFQLSIPEYNWMSIICVLSLTEFRVCPRSALWSLTARSAWPWAPAQDRWITHSHTGSLHRTLLCATLYRFLIYPFPLTHLVRCCSMTYVQASRSWLKITSTTSPSNRSTSTTRWTSLCPPTPRSSKCGTKTL